MLSQDEQELNDQPFKILGMAAKSGTGKTTLLKQLIPALKHRGLRLGLIKHTHHKIEFDNRGITKAVFESGTDVLATSQALSIAEWHHNNAETALWEGIKRYGDLPIDLLLIEGFKSEAFPKIELHRKSLSEKPLFYEKDKHIIAIASDDANTIKLKNINLPVLDLNNVEAIADWIMNSVMTRAVNSHKDDIKKCH